MPSARETVQALLDRADIGTGGERPHDLLVHDDRLHARVLAQGALGMGEAYMDGWWDCPRLDLLAERLLRADLEREVRPSLPAVWHLVRAKLLNLQNRRRGKRVAREHYDRGNDLFQAMLDPYMQYSCACWQDGDTLAEAQERKMELICRKLHLEPGMRLLDIGCGWGGLARYVAERHGVSVQGITISREQASLAREATQGLPVDVQLRDYRELKGEFDRVVSVGMFEHVGEKNYRRFFSVVRRCLASDGLFLLHTIGKNRPSAAVNRWTHRYIFPNGQLPSPSQIAHAAEGTFVLEDWDSFGEQYDRTLMAWWRNFETAWPHLQDRYGERFYRMWRYYLLTCAGAFRSRRIQLWQIVFSPGGVDGGYEAVRWGEEPGRASTRTQDLGQSHERLETEVSNNP
jgi:cyclopropane-fatty-acyl-phospholipid synthase